MEWHPTSNFAGDVLSLDFFVTPHNKLMAKQFTQFDEQSSKANAYFHF